jgi:ABC-type glutathione transport system ATPase component
LSTTHHAFSASTPSAHRRIQTLLLKAELEDPSAADERCAHSDEPIRIDGGTFAWAVDETAAEATTAAVSAVTSKPLSEAGTTKDAVAVTVPEPSTGASTAVPAEAAASASESAPSSLIPSSPAILHDIDFSVRRGSLTVVVGSVGCGKTSLALACLGEMVQRGGTRHCAGPVAYVAQARVVSGRAGVVIAQQK